MVQVWRSPQPSVLVIFTVPWCVDEVCPSDAGIKIADRPTIPCTVAALPGGSPASLWNEDADLFAAEIAAADSQAAALVPFHVGVQCLTEWIAFNRKFLEYPEVVSTPVFHCFLMLGT